ncbi:MAG TPA: PadR family transcriptional regulator [Sphingomicrobium sp.]|nr:PadR family transcriptional regulator [Sphingomicrobium sp.]
MRHRHHGCVRRGHIEINLPEGLLAMRGGRGWGGWRGSWGPFEFDIDGEAARGRRRGRIFEGGELRLLLLRLISDEPRHGYDLIRAIEELTGGSYVPSPGVIYPTLTMLEEMGLIAETPGEGARKPFAITEAGRAHLDDNAEQAEELIQRLKTLSPTHHSEGISPVWRAMRNLGMAIRNRLHHGELGEETVHELAALIDEFAQRIERLK